MIRYLVGGWSKVRSNGSTTAQAAPCTRTVEEIPNGPGTYQSSTPNAVTRGFALCVL